VSVERRNHEGITSSKPLAVVTGASSGIGYELAKQFAEHGFDLLVAAEDAGIPDRRARLANNLAAHMAIEQNLFYPAVRDVDGRMVAESYEEHAIANWP